MATRLFRNLFRRTFAVLLLCGLAQGAIAQSGYTQTRHPIVLAHGLLGFDSILGVYDYWYGMPSDLRAGGARVYVASYSASNYSEVRGEQLIRDLDTLRAIYGHQKFNLVGHSHGGPTIRYVAAVRPDLVASVTSIGSPHTGSKVADGLSTTFPAGSYGRTLVAGFVNALSTFIAVMSGNNDPQDALGALTSLNSAGAAQFNARYGHGMPATSCGAGASVSTIPYRGVNHSVRNYSWGGTSVLTHVLDASDPLLGAGSLFFGSEQNDGLVGRCSSHFGVVLRDDYGWNHLDEVNQILGLTSWFASDPKSVLRAHANRLKVAGL